MRSFGVKTLIIILAVLLSFPTVYAGAAEKAVSFSLSCDSEAYYGGEIIVKIAVSKPSKALAGLEFTLSYNPDYVVPQITENSDTEREMDVFSTTVPQGWEQFHFHSAESNLYHFRFIMPQSGSSYLDSENELVLEIPFTVCTPGSFDFSISDSDIIAIGADDALTPYSGSGDSLTVNAAGEAEKVSVVLGSDGKAPEKSTYNLNVAITNLGDSAGIIAVEFDLVYDKTVFEPIYKTNSQSEMNVFMVSMPQNSWEQMCTLYEADGKYTLRFAASSSDDADKAETLDSGEVMTISIPFKVIGSEGDTADFSVNAASVVALNNVMGIISGRGDSKNVAIEKAINVLPENLGYEIKDGCLLYVPEKTDISDFLAPLGTLYLTSNGNRVDSGYVCTGYVLTDGSSLNLTVVVKGDVDRSGEVDMFDYLMVKTICFERYTPDTAQFYAAAVADGQEITAFDYLQIKSHYFGTFDLNA